MYPGRGAGDTPPGGAFPTMALWGPRRGLESILPPSGYNGITGPRIGRNTGRLYNDRIAYTFFKLFFAYFPGFFMHKRKVFCIDHLYIRISFDFLECKHAGFEFMHESRISLHTGTVKPPTFRAFLISDGITIPYNGPVWPSFMRPGYTHPVFLCILLVLTLVR